MLTIMDYIAQTAPRSVAELPWSDADQLVLSALCYNAPGALAASNEGIALRDLAPRLDLLGQTGTEFTVKCRALLYAIADTVRYGDMQLFGFVSILDSALPIQFSAVACRVSQQLTVIAYRGTDNTLAGWREDLHMSFESPVPAQEAAVYYLERIAALTSGALMLTGHSKGGNLAAYAAAHANEATQRRIASVCSFDGPGLDNATVLSEGYHRIKPVLHSFVPQGSIVGLLMGHELDYVIVRSSAMGFAQHDLFTWQFQGLTFETMSETTLPSQLADQTLHTFLKTGTPQQRRLFVDGLFHLLEATDAETLRELKRDKAGAAAKILVAALDMDEPTRNAFVQTAFTLVSSGAKSIWDYASDLPRALAREHLSSEDRLRLQAFAEQLSPDAVARQLQSSVRSISQFLSSHTKGGNDHHES